MTRPLIILLSVVAMAHEALAQGRSPNTARGRLSRGATSTGRPTVTTRPIFRPDRPGRQERDNDGQASSDDAPAAVAQVAWNTSAPQAGRPFFVYIAPHPDRRAENEFHTLLGALVTSSHVIRASRGMVCESIGLDQLPFVSRIKGREAMYRCLRSLAIKKIAEPQLFILDERGGHLQRIRGVEQLRSIGVSGLFKLMKEAQAAAEERRKKPDAP